MKMILQPSEEPDEVGALLAGSIETSMRTVLQTVAPRASVSAPSTGQNKQPTDDERFEQVPLSPFPSTVNYPSDAPYTNLYRWFPYICSCLSRYP